MSIALAAASFGGQAASAPLQSSSTALPHVSAAGAPGVALHATPVCWPLQTCWPVRAHAPSPTVHDWPTVNGSSIPFLQSSSTALQSSTLFDVASLHVVPPAPLQTIMPSLHASVSAPSHGVPTPKPSSI